MAFLSLACVTYGVTSPSNGGKLLSCDFKIFLLRVNVNVFHRGKIFPAAHGLKCLVVHASAIGAGSKCVPKAVRRLSINIDGFLHALPEAPVSLKCERGMRINKRSKNVRLRVV